MKLLIKVSKLNYKAKSYYCLKCGKNRSVESIYPRVSNTNNDKTVTWSKYVTCGIVKNLNLVKNKKEVEY